MKTPVARNIIVNIYITAVFHYLRRVYETHRRSTLNVVFFLIYFVTPRYSKYLLFLVLKYYQNNKYLKKVKLFNSGYFDIIR